MVPFKALAAIGSFILPALAQDQISYMPFGDSITEFGCWRAQVWQKLQDDGHTNVDFVGSMTSQTECQAINYDRGHEGHAGFQAVNIASQNQLVGWLASNPADIVTMHLGTNDIVAGRSTDQILDAFTTLVEQMRASNPEVRIIVAQIIPLSFADQNVQALNAAIPAWAEGLNSETSPVWVVNQYEGFTSGDLSDGVHPNASGDTKMANKWHPAIVEAIASIQGRTAARKREIKFSG
ncbi:hypothetical protein AJ79_06041 [Helicocarpus griseus UAMH5409]|uniref:SGNH hydrolase-type esterase domain-containing protein n=1 Tax=Helicocarpus griseus UAMH5409 TaxID=1447875 RepID=A0A2B7XH54_9EURO|nr:hypothetical protein AJ79_06041 [Helicocarpus griseus UAMH5409]